MSQKMDRRKIRTKLSLREALLELMQEKGIEGITVSDLADRADINRGTFYLHYRDVYDLLEQTKAEFLAGLKKELIHINPPQLLSYAAKDEPFPPVVKVFEYLAKHAEFLKVVFGPKGDPSYQLEIKQFMKNHFMLNLPGWQPPIDKQLVPLDYLVAYSVSANLGILQHWLETGMTYPPNEIAMMMTRIINLGPMASAGLKQPT